MISVDGVPGFLIDRSHFCQSSLEKSTRSLQGSGLLDIISGLSGVFDR